MLTNILGIIWILIGLLWLVKPDMLKNRLKKKVSRKIRWVVFGFIIMFIFVLLGSIIKTQGLLLKIIGIAIIILMIRGILFITSKTLEKVLNWLSEKPLISFRIWALIIFLAGLVLVFIY